MTFRTESRVRGFVACATLALSAAVGAGLVASPAHAATKPTKAVKPAKTAAKGPTTFPSMKVLDLTNNKTFDLATLNASAKPQLIWFWAPT